MGWIKEIEEANAKGALKETYRVLKQKRGKIANILKIQSLNPTALEAHMELYQILMFKQEELSREDCEMIGVVVSVANKCYYCIKHHSEALNFYWRDRERIERFVSDHKSARLKGDRHTLVEYVIKLTKKPYDIKGEDIDYLREAGFSEAEILNINLIASYFNFVNRIASGLGVNFSPEEVKGYKF